MLDLISAHADTVNKLHDQHSLGATFPHPRHSQPQRLPLPCPLPELHRPITLSRVVALLLQLRAEDL